MKIGLETAITAGIIIVLASGGTMLPVLVGAAIVGMGIGLCLNTTKEWSIGYVKPILLDTSTPMIIGLAILLYGE